MARVLLRSRLRGGPHHSLYNEIVDDPPDGYEFFFEPPSSSAFTTLAYLLDRRLTSSSHLGKVWMEGKPPVQLALLRFFDRRPTPPCDLVYSSNSLVFRDIRWVADAECVDALVGYGDIRACAGAVAKVVSSRSCKGILAWSDWSRLTLLKGLGGAAPEGKIKVVRLAVRRKKPVARHPDGKVRLLFVGSVNPTNKANFELKGGVDLLESFVKLSKRYDNLELTVRSWVPEGLFRHYSRHGGIRFLRNYLNSEQLGRLYAESDVFVFPSHANLGMAILEAMSYGLPVVALAVYDVPEAVKHNETGLLLSPSPSVPYYTWNGSPNHLDGRFRSAIQLTRSRLVGQLVQQLPVLIEDPALRRRLGSQGLLATESGEFSTANRNRVLKSLLEEALEN